MNNKLYLYTDGGSRNNPGQAAIGAVLMDGEKIISKLSKRIGIATNNEAEYTALIQGIEMALKYTPKELRCFMDSELVIKQLNGIYRIKEPRLQKLGLKAKDLIKQIEKVSFEHIPRSKNSLADSLVNNALDNK